MDVIRDPLWNNVRVDARSMRLVDSPPFQRLRYVRQLGWAHLVYPGATHARFEHALGAYHLGGLALSRLHDEKQLRDIPADDPQVVRAALLLHDIGHYPFSHALEEIGAPHHEEVARPLITEGVVAGILREIAPDAPQRVHALICGRSSSPLQGLVSGSLDLDKIDYLKRDALMCGVPYGEIDVDRLMNALTIARDPRSGALTIAVLEKGLSALESLLFAKYQMYRNVYWHHAVRSATAMYKRLVADVLAAGTVEQHELASFSDEALLHALESRGSHDLLIGLRSRRLFKRAFECPAAELPEGWGEWLATDAPRLRAAEMALATSIGVAPADLLIDFPEKTQMLGLDIPVVRRDGEIHHLTSQGIAGAINLPVLSDQLYRSARWLRVFVRNPVAIPREHALEILGAG